LRHLVFVLFIPNFLLAETLFFNPKQQIHPKESLANQFYLLGGMQSLNIQTKESSRTVATSSSINVFDAKFGFQYFKTLKHAFTFEYTMGSDSTSGTKATSQQIGYKYYFYNSGSEHKVEFPGVMLHSFSPYSLFLKCDYKSSTYETSTTGLTFSGLEFGIGGDYRTSYDFSLLAEIRNSIMFNGTIRQLSALSLYVGVALNIF
jgi:hypothetical protein